ncbi:MAG TPA: prepilin-type N-terminal cleavage/methylation domain-containing protein [Candidatus Hydrogenedentes bacterium]|nr:prepilin-type N-terminal cleavage/methylation domain-containing protein [Candidatus Hydrogenedentota bacterium]HIJ74958.1 prepilin-type N-terminal cleavage/methylation domain-containing protein [Candidatus Hydrogenedentota bacterium]
MNKKGMTLIEVLFATAILTVVMGTLFILARSLGDTVAVEDAKVTTQDEARAAMYTIIKELRQADDSSIQFEEEYGSFLIYSIAEDVDGNGTAVDVDGNLETGPLRAIAIDFTDYNYDTARETQLLLFTLGPTGYEARVLCNDLAPPEDTDGDGIPELGVSFSRWSSDSILVTIRTQRQVGTTGPILNSVMSEIIFPRN